MQEIVDRWLFDPTIGKLIGAIVGLAVIHIIVRILQRSIAPYVKDPDARYRARKIITFLGYFAGILILAAIFSDRLGRLTVAFGVAGAGVAFALQEVIASFAGWAAIYFAGFFRVGDRIQLGGIMGDVIDVGVLRTTLMECGQWVKADQYNGRIVRVANSFVFKDPVFNYSASFPFLWDEIVVPVKYGSDNQLAGEIFNSVVNDIVGDFAASAKEEWKAVVTKYRIEDARIEPMVTMSANDNYMEFTLRYIVDYKKRRTTKDLIWRRILEEIAKTDRRVAIGSAGLEILETSVLEVRMAGGGTN